MDVIYRKDAPLSTDQLIDLLERSTLGERRPIHDIECMAGMIEHADLTITAWLADKLVGIARSVTDFHYACYLSDLAVDASVQHEGIGKELISQTESALGSNCTLILISAPQAMDYYPKLGFVKNDRCWVKAD